jgi:hypothetical protein
MAKGKAFLVVGHRHWGKSRTLRALCDDKKGGWVIIKGKRFFVRLMSNDDLPDSYLEFIESLDPAKKPLVIMAYCAESPPHALATALGKEYDLFFWVLEHKFKGRPYRGEDSVSAGEIEQLRKLGTVECYADRGAEAHVRAGALEVFVMANVPQNALQANDEKAATMRIPLTDGSGRSFDPDKSRKTWEKPATYEETVREIQGYHNDFDAGERLYLTADGTFVLCSWNTAYSLDSDYRAIETDEAAAWLGSNGYHADLLDPALEMGDYAKQLDLDIPKGF